LPSGIDRHFPKTGKNIVSAITPKETITRTELIDTQLVRAGWSKQRKILLEEVLLQVATPDQSYGKDQYAYAENLGNGA